MISGTFTDQALTLAFTRGESALPWAYQEALALLTTALGEALAEEYLRSIPEEHRRSVGQLTFARAKLTADNANSYTSLEYAYKELAVFATAVAQELGS
jgi:hypothetical protein